MEEVKISTNVKGVEEVSPRDVERASQWRLYQDVFGHHRVDEPRYCATEAEMNRCLKFGFVAACLLTALILIVYEWILTWTDYSCGPVEDISRFPENCSIWKFIYYKLWRYLSFSIGPNGIALLAIFTALLTVRVLAKTNVTRGGILMRPRRQPPLTAAGNVQRV